MEKHRESYADYADLDELDDLDVYELVYQVRVVGYDENDEETGYEKLIKTFNSYDQAERAADLINKKDIETYSDDEVYVRINIVPIIRGADFIEEQTIEYSRVIILK